jgi:ubiquinone/menaquinone biosynthesis C-methylase UbiE
MSSGKDMNAGESTKSETRQASNGGIVTKLREYPLRAQIPAQYGHAFVRHNVLLLSKSKGIHMTVVHSTVPSLHALTEDAKTRVLLRLIEARHGTNFNSALVVGCGSGYEAFAIREYFNCSVVGIDITSDFFRTPPQDRTELKVMNAAELQFPNAEFDLLYSFHAIEHIRELATALHEMRRVLKLHGCFCLGTPNKQRLIGYIGSPTSLRNKILWNLQDYNRRIRHEWDNNYGAHAGFTRSELLDMCAETFGTAIDATSEYYRLLYEAHYAALDKAVNFGLADRLFPAVYATGVCHEIERCSTGLAPGR